VTTCKEGRLDLNDTCGQPQLATSKRVELEVGGTTITADRVVKLDELDDAAEC
jgi:hypothetical protein